MGRDKDGVKAGIGGGSQRKWDPRTGVGLGDGGVVPETGAHTKDTVRKGTEPRLGSSSRGQTGSGGAQGTTVLRWGWTGPSGTAQRPATLARPGLVPALRW